MSITGALTSIRIPIIRVIWHRRDVVGEPGDEGGGGKVLDVGKGEALYLPVLCVTDVGAEAHAGLGGQRRCAHTQRQTDRAISTIFRPMVRM